MLKNNPYMEAYLNIIKEDVDDDNENIEDQLEDLGFSTYMPEDDITIKLLQCAKSNQQKVYQEIIPYLDVEQNDDGEYYVSMTQFVDWLYTDFPIDVIDDPQFKQSYQLFKQWYDEVGYDGWSGYGDRGQQLNNYEIIDMVCDVFGPITDGSESCPKIVSGDDESDDDEYWD